MYIERLQKKRNEALKAGLRLAEPEEAQEEPVDIAAEEPKPSAAAD